MSTCLFCAIIADKAKGDIVYRDDTVVAFNDISPRAPVHLLIVPRKHIGSLLDLTAEDGPAVAHIFAVATELARERGISRSGFRIVVNCGTDAGQSVFHLHYHLLGGRPFSWPPG
jgi:histidine triad (HIT) family protein